MKEQAVFVKRPRTIEELRSNNTIRELREYRIVKKIILPKIEYENFVTDLLADRQFIENNAAFCVEENDCLLISSKNRNEEILVIPMNGCFVNFAAIRVQ